ncbi:hypothetical protein MUK42_16671 [Musa troglodytarum]|uniref:Uncharacterized protein n=1 Tax=Musa troglodytarum TaxID=320322 RepID=A0A9E7HI59_9LILI|nr:hypothetical protein MUK42_16671 [Musa troglodytarum]
MTTAHVAPNPQFRVSFRRFIPISYVEELDIEPAKRNRKDRVEDGRIFGFAHVLSFVIEIAGVLGVLVAPLLDSGGQCFAFALRYHCGFAVAVVSMPDIGTYSFYVLILAVYLISRITNVYSSSLYYRVKFIIFLDGNTESLKGCHLLVLISLHPRKMKYIG